MIVLQNDCILRLFVTNDIRFAVKRKVLLIAAQPFLRIGRPTDIDVIRRRMKTTIHQSDRTSLFAEIHLTIVAHYVEIAVNEQCTFAKRTPKWLLSIEVEITMTIGRCAIQRIVSTLEMTVLIIGILCTIQRIKVQTADEAHLLGYQTVSMHIANMGLCDSIATFFSI